MLCWTYIFLWYIVRGNIRFVFNQSCSHGSTSQCEMYFFFGKDCKLKGCKSKSINYFNVFFLINRFATKHFTKWNKQIMLTFVVLCCFINVFPSFIHKTNRWIISIRKKTYSTIYFLHVLNMQTPDSYKTVFIYSTMTFLWGFKVVIIKFVIIVLS